MGQKLYKREKINKITGIWFRMMVSLGNRDKGWDAAGILLGMGYYKGPSFVLGGGFIGAYCTINYS